MRIDWTWRQFHGVSTITCVCVLNVVLFVSVWMFLWLITLQLWANCHTFADATGGPIGCHFELKWADLHLFIPPFFLLLLTHCVFGVHNVLLLGTFDSNRFERLSQVRQVCTVHCRAHLPFISISLLFFFFGLNTLVTIQPLQSSFHLHLSIDNIINICPCCRLPCISWSWQWKDEKDGRDCTRI